MTRVSQCPISVRSEYPIHSNDRMIVNEELKTLKEEAVLASETLLA
jgi:hypothetical protein